MFRKASSLIELILVFALAALLLPVLISGLTSSREGKAQQMQRFTANALLKESQEAIKSIKERGWSSLPQNGTYHVEIAQNKWTFATGSATSDGYTTAIVVDNVFRDQLGLIATTGGILDTSTKKITTTISWNTPFVSNLTAVTYLARFRNNTTQTQSTENEFKTGSLSATVVTNSAGGEIILGAGLGGKAKWCVPSFSNVSVDLPEVPIAVSATTGHVYVAMGKTGATAASFAHMLVTNSDPFTYNLHGRLNGGYKTSAVFGEPDWGYIALTNTSGQRIKIINLNEYVDIPNKIYKEEGYFSVSGNSYPASTIFIFNNRGYVTIGGYLYVFDLSSRSGSRPQIGSRILFTSWFSTSPAKEIYLRKIGTKTYVFVAIDGTYQYELSIIDVTNESDSNQWKVVGRVDIDSDGCSNLQKTKGVYVKPDGLRAYISDSNADDFKEFFVVDTENKTNPFVIGGNPQQPACTGGGGYEAGSLDPKQSAVTLPLENRAILVGIGGEEYQVLDLSDEANPVRCGGLNYDPGIYGVASAQEVNGDVFAYLITGNSSQDIKIIEGGPDIVGGKYVPFGTYESTPLDVGQSVSFNRISAAISQPPGTLIKLQVAVSPITGGSCANSTYSYIGPDGSSASYFEPIQNVLDVPMPFGQIGQCIRYKFILATTDLNQTPVINSLLFNYSP
jgi:type II secretory pathway pseudopilin PulG